jgi:hypothetical protein
VHDGARSNGDIAFQLNILTYYRFRMDCELVAAVITASPLRGGHEASCITYMGGMSLQQGGNPNPSNLSRKLLTKIPIA